MSNTLALKLNVCGSNFVGDKHFTEVYCKQLVTQVSIQTYVMSANLHTVQC